MFEFYTGPASTQDYSHRNFLYHAPTKTRRKKITQQIQRLKDGNARFVRGESTHDHANTESLRSELAEGQKPFAIILGCSDSRVPVELVFDQSLGDLFVIRIAGNIANPSQIASAEFAVQQFGVGLIVVLGHTRCGAVEATVTALRAGKGDAAGYIVNRIRPVIAPLLEQGLTEDEVMEQGIRSNVAYSVNTLLEKSKVLAAATEAESLRIVGAEYDLASGKVEFFD